jgi:bifunctional DNA-binding transcriptional regulator/antitoxin component of YhaV-PrlF toxin-antitoxin module
MRTLTYEVEIGADGELSLPLELRESLGLQVGDSLKLIQTEDNLVMIPTQLLVPEFADYMSKLLAEQGISAIDFLDGAKEEREKLFKERYGDLTTN